MRTIVLTVHTGGQPVARAPVTATLLSTDIGRDFYATTGSDGSYARRHCGRLL